MAGGYLRGVLGWVEGRNVVFEHRYAEPERYPVLAAELVRLGSTSSLRRARLPPSQ